MRPMTSSVKQQGKSNVMRWTYSIQIL